MEAFLILKNVIGNLINIILYMMPFGIFDSASYFIDIYSSPFLIFLLEVISIFMGVIFLIYLFELFNIPINPLEAEIHEKNNEKDKIESFLSSTISFIFGKSNVGTFFPKVLEFITQVSYKIIPVFVILVLMYTSFFPTGRGYNTVGEFLSENGRLGGYAIFGNSFLSDEEAERQLKFNKLKKTDNEQNIIVYKDNKIILKELKTSTLANEKLNDQIEEEVNMYAKVYDKESYDKYIKDINQERNLEISKLEKLEAEKDVETNKEKLQQLIIEINKKKETIERLKNNMINAGTIYRKLTYKIDRDNIEKVYTRLKNETGYKNVQLLLLKDLKKIKENPTSKDSIKNGYNELANILSNYKGGEITTDGRDTNINRYIKYINNFIYKMSSDKQKSAIIEIRSLLVSQLKSIENPPSLSQLDKNILRLEKNLNSLEKDMAASKDIDKSPLTRINYIIDANAEALAKYPVGEKEDYRQGLLLLQYKLLNKKNNINNEEAFKIRLLQNKVEYIGLGAIKNYGVFMGIISAILTFMFYFILVLMAGWKNMLLLYTSFLSFTANKIESFIGKERTNAINTHVAYLINNVLKGEGEIDEETKSVKKDTIKDPEYIWFEEHKSSRETYIIMIIEVAFRFGLIYWLFFF